MTILFETILFKNPFKTAVGTARVTAHCWLEFRSEGNIIFKNGFKKRALSNLRRKW